MTQPNLDEIKEVSSLLDKIKQYKLLLENSISQLQETKNYYKIQEKIEKQKIQDDIIQKRILEELKHKIVEYRIKELRQKTDNYKQFSIVFDNYIKSDLFKQLVNSIIKELQSSDFLIMASGDLKDTVPKGLKIVEGQSGQLRISDNQKEYILDPLFLKKITFDRLIVSQYSNTK